MIVLLCALFLWTSQSAYAAPQAPTATVIDQDISTNTTWTKAGSPYQLTSTAFTVDEGVSLTIEPGVQVIAAANGHFQVRGTLIAQGTAAEPILFTSAEKTPGAWYGITVGYTTEQPAAATLDHVVIEYGSVPELEHYGAITVNRGSLTLRNSIIRNAGSNGVMAEMGQPITIADTNFVDNGNYAVRLTNPSTHDPILSNLTATGAGKNKVAYYNVDVAGPHTLEAMGLPYAIDGGLRVDPEGTLNVAPGLELQVATGFYVDGVLNALGTAAAPITFTGLNKTPGGWWGLDISGGNTGLAHARLDHVVIEYGGSANSDFSANLIVTTAAVTVTNSTIRNGISHGIADHGGAPGEGHQLVLDNVRIENNAGAALLTDDESANPTLRAITATGNHPDALVNDAGLDGDHVWENVGLPYAIRQDLGIQGSLTIEPGVTVQMLANDGRIHVSGSLFAIGTITQPIKFTGAHAQPGSWTGIQYNGDDESFLVLRYCDIGYGGSDETAMLRLYAPTAFVTNCHIHHSADDGIEVQTLFSQPVIARNRIEANAFGLENRGGRIDIEAQDNWWGDASGPLHSTNPAGKGNAVSDKVIFTPWLKSADETDASVSGLAVRLDGPGRFSPGDTEQYQVFYANYSDKALNNAVLRVVLPPMADYIDNSGGGIHWPERDQIFWKLGTIAPGAQGYLAVRVRFDFGLPDGLRATTVAQLSGTDLTPAPFDVAPYLNFVPRAVTTETALTEAQVQAERAAHAQFGQLYDYAVAQGYQFGDATQRVYTTGETETMVILLRAQPQFGAFYLWRHGEKAVGMAFDGSSVAVHRNGQFTRYDTTTDNWSQAQAGAAAVDEIDWTECMQNCIAEKLPGYILKKKVKDLSTVSKAIDCVLAVKGDEGSYLGCAKTLKKVIPGIGEGIDLGLCNSDCEECNGTCDDARCHCCTDDKRFCDNQDWLYGFFGTSVKKIARCSLETGRYLAAEVYEVCAQCETCIDGGGGPACTAKSNLLVAAGTENVTARLSIAGSGEDSQCDECRKAKDPNELFGPAGDLLPGQLVTYTITYENVGAGIAHDVFVINELGEHFDVSTLSIQGGGKFSAGSRSIFWRIGELAPKGQTGSTGTISYSVRLKSGLPNGTVISNQAVVHFPSVPEETPTNTWVNVVQTLSGIPQTITTAAGKAVNITLLGREINNAPLTFTVTEAPLYGKLTGTAPNLTYTPFGTFTGVDRIVFTASNGPDTSRPAEVLINVTPAGNDKSAPTILWTAPSANARVDLGEVVPIPSPEGSLYAPFIQVQFSEQVDGATVTAANLLVKTAAGQTVTAAVRYDGTTDQALIYFKSAPQPNTQYTVTVLPGVKDLNGNALGAQYAWSFQLGTVSAPVNGIFMPVIRR